MNLRKNQDGDLTHGKADEADILTCVSTYAPSGTRRREKDDGVAQKLDVILQCLPLLSSKLRVGRIKLQPACKISEWDLEKKTPETFYTA